MKKFILMLVTFSLAGCSVFGIRTTEELQYVVIDRMDDIAIRQYAPYIVAEVEMSGASYDDKVDSGFRILAGYIFGDNETNEEIAMTAPVTEQRASEKIAMTAPVITRDIDGKRIMAFSMPAKYTMESLPKPVDQRVKLRKVDTSYQAVIGYSGFFDNLEKRSKYERQLVDWLASSEQYQAVSSPTYAGYDPPWTIPFLRRNEVMITVEELTQQD